VDVTNFSILPTTDLNLKNHKTTRMHFYLSANLFLSPRNPVGDKAKKKFLNDKTSKPEETLKGFSYIRIHFHKKERKLLTCSFISQFAILFMCVCVCSLNPFIFRIRLKNSFQIHPFCSLLFVFFLCHR
jgi:hypothetical protein